MTESSEDALREELRLLRQEVARLRRLEESDRKDRAESDERTAARTERITEKNADLVSEIGERRQAESDLQNKQRNLEQQLDARDHDRQLVAYEIHDTFVQDVIGALMYLDSFCDARQAAGDEHLEQLQTARLLLRKSVAAARLMISGLRPPVVHEHGIAAAVESLVSEVNQRGLEIHFVQNVKVERLPARLESTILSIAQEALTNIERHSKSQNAQVKLSQVDNAIQLEVRDFGVGFVPDQVGVGHYGLQGIKERARLVGGSVALESGPGAGTELVVTIPLP